MYRQPRIRQFADFLREMVAYVSPNGLPWKIDAPSSLIANMMSRDDTRALHLFNWTGCKHESPLQNVYYIPPIENVEVPREGRIVSVKLFTPDEFSRTVEWGVLEVTLPRVDKYRGVVIEME